MFFNPSTNELSGIQLEGYLPYICENPVDTQYYTIYSEPEITLHADKVTYTHYKPKHLDTVKSEFILRIKDKFERGNKTGFTCLGHVFDSDATALSRMNAVYTVAADNPDFTTYWITKDNQVVELSNSDIKALGMAALQFQSGLIIKSRTDKDAVLACQSLEELLTLT